MLETVYSHQDSIINKQHQWQKEIPKKRGKGSVCTDKACERAIERSETTATLTSNDMADVLVR